MTEGNYVLVNGELLDASVPYLKGNRSFLYGDGLFESIRIINGQPYKLENHIIRIKEGAKVLGYAIPEEFTTAYFKDQIVNLLKHNSIRAGGKVRLCLFRNDGGLYKPSNNTVSYLITADLLPYNLFKLNEEGLLLDVFYDIYKDKNILSNFKTTNALLSVMAGNYANSNKLDDCLLVNSNRNIIEAISSNVFLVSNGVLYTPPLSDGCVGGTMRMNVINTALQMNLKVYETSLTPQNLMVADEIFLTNAIQGIQWVGGYKSKRYFNNIGKNILDTINQKEANLKMDLEGN